MNFQRKQFDIILKARRPPNLLPLDQQKVRGELEEEEEATTGL